MFQHRRSERVWKEFAMYLAMNDLGLGIMPFTADSIAGGVIGLILGTIFRFLTYRYFVFNEELGDLVETVPVGGRIH